MGAAVLLFGGLAAIFVALTLVAGAIGAVTTERHQVARSLAVVRSLSVSKDAPDASQPPFVGRVVLPALERLGGVARLFTPGGQVERISRRLQLAGSPAGWDTERVLAFKMLGLIAVGVGGGVLGAVAGMGTGARLVLLVGGAGLGFVVPDLVMRSVAARRQERIAHDLPDALDLLTISVEAGLGFDAAMAQVARNTEGPLAEEFFRVLQEMQIGSARHEAMRALVDRTDVPDLRTFITSVVQADGFGIPVANVLRVQAKEMRLKRMQRAEEQAQKVPVKILFPLIFCILPGLFVVVLGPAAISIIRNFKF